MDARFIIAVHPRVSVGHDARKTVGPPKPGQEAGGTIGDTTYFWGGGCEQDWKFLYWGDSVLSCIGHAKE